MKTIRRAALAAMSACALAGGGLGKLNDASLPVAFSPGGVGDYLVAPLYIASAGWYTDLKIVNLSTVYATVAKVVVRERVRAKEQLAFLLFLGPGDAWRGSLSCAKIDHDACAQLALTSADTGSLPQYAFDTEGRITLAGVLGGGEMGYIDVIESAAWALGAAPVAPARIVAQHNADVLAAFPGDDKAVPSRLGFGDVPVGQAQVGKNVLGKIGYAESRSDHLAATENILTGNVRLVNPLYGSSTTLPLTAIANYRNAAPLTVGVPTGIGTDAPANPSPSYTTLGALELALNRNDWMLPYDADSGTTLASVTFPTRQTFDAVAHGGNTASSPGIYPFSNDKGQLAYASLRIRDEQQQELDVVLPQISSAFPSPSRPWLTALGFLLFSPGRISARDEAGFLNIVGTQNFQSGWADFNIDRQTGAPLSFPGAPAIVTQMLWTSNGNSLRGEWWYPQFKTTMGANSND